MIVIADSNIFYSSLITPNGTIAAILKDRNMQFLAPDYIIEEVKEHITDIQKALTIVEDIDEDDYPFIAMCFQYKHKIWSRDKELILGLTEKGFGHFFYFYR